METFFSLLLVIAAFVGGYFAYKNIDVLREQHRRNTFLELMDEISSERARENREKIYEYFDPKKSSSANEQALFVEAYVENGRFGSVGEKRLKNAIEETIACFDKIGFFLLRGDPKLKDEAPVWIWPMTNEMWERLGSYVKLRQQVYKDWGKYFEQLADEAKKRLDASTKPIDS